MFDVETIKAFKACIKGLTTKEISTEYVLDEETGKMKIVKQKINEKTLPPNIDLLKLLFPKVEQENKDYNKLSDEELEQEKIRLLKELKESEIENRKNKNKNKVWC